MNSGQSKTPIKLQEIEYSPIQMLCIEFFPPSDRDRNRDAPVGTAGQSTPLGGEARPEMVGRNNNYMMHLFGWSAWWSWVTKQAVKENGHEQSNISKDRKSLVENRKLQQRIKKSEEEKAKFVDKYYIGKNRPKKSNVEEEPKGKLFTGTNGGCTPKRLRNCENFKTGELKVHRRKENLTLKKT